MLTQPQVELVLTMETINKEKEYEAMKK